MRPLAEVQVTLYGESESSGILKGFTDFEGKVVFKDLTLKDLKLEIDGPKGVITRRVKFRSHSMQMVHVLIS